MSATKERTHKHYRDYCRHHPAIGEYIITVWFDGEPELYTTADPSKAIPELIAYYVEDWNDTGRILEFDVAQLLSRQAVPMDQAVRNVMAKAPKNRATTQAKFRIKQGGYRVNELNSYQGVEYVARNPFGEGVDVVEIIHRHDPATFVQWIKDQSIGAIILEPI